MIAKKIQIINETGLHARPAQLFVRKASEFQAVIKVRKEDGTEADAKSILGLMTLALQNGAVITIEATGADEERAVNELANLVESGMGDE